MFELCTFCMPQQCISVFARRPLAQHKLWKAVVLIHVAMVVLRTSSNLYSRPSKVALVFFLWEAVMKLQSTTGKPRKSRLVTWRSWSAFGVSLFCSTFYKGSGMERSILTGVCSRVCFFFRPTKTCFNGDSTLNDSVDSLDSNFLR